MRIDLHTHSSRSDGTATPSELVAHAAEVGIDVLALTDHDTTDGWAGGRRRGHGPRCRPGAGHGAELPFPRARRCTCWRTSSTRCRLELREELDRILGGRDARLPQTIARLNAVGIDIAESDVPGRVDCRCGAGPASRRGRARRSGGRRQPRRGLRAVPRSVGAGLRRPVRRGPRAGPHPGGRGRWSSPSSRTPGPSDTAAGSSTRRRSGRWRSSGWPGSRSTIRTTTRTTRRRLRELATEARPRRHRVPATSTVRARSTTTSGAT